MNIEELPAIEVSGLCSALSSEELVKAIILHKDWCWVTKQKSNREKLAKFIPQSTWMDSRLFQLLSATPNPWSLDGEQLFEAAKYVFCRNRAYKVFRNTCPRRWEPLAPANNKDDEKSDGAIEDDESADLNQHSRIPLTNFYSFNYHLMPPMKSYRGVKKEKIVYYLSILPWSLTNEKADFMKHPLWKKSNVKKIRKSHLVEIAFTQWTVESHEEFFWDVVKSFASLMNPSQVLSIRVMHDTLLPQEMASLWQDMYARLVRADNTWLMDLPIKWKLHFSPSLGVRFLQEHEWCCDLYS